MLVTLTSSNLCGWSSRRALCSQVSPSPTVGHLLLLLMFWKVRRIKSYLPLLRLPAFHELLLIFVIFWIRLLQDFSLILALAYRELILVLYTCQDRVILGYRDENMLVVLVLLSDTVCVFYIVIISFLWSSSAHLNDQKSARNLKLAIFQQHRSLIVSSITPTYGNLPDKKKVAVSLL